MRLNRLAAIAALLLPACTPLPPAAETAPPTVGAAREMFVVAANPLAAEAGMAVLKRGGSAVDAAVAVQAMLSLVEPQSSGIGGGAFMTYLDAASGRVRVYDGREVAPAGAVPSMFVGNDGKPLPFRDAVTSGRATGVPGAVAMLATAHRAHGKLAWRTLSAPHRRTACASRAFRVRDAERTARDGFVVTPRLGRFLGGSFPQLQTADARAYFAKPGGGLVGVGDRLRNPAYAQFLTRLAAQGPDALYKGQTAARIVQKVRAAPLEGTMTLADLAAYKPAERAALCRRWAGYRACVPPPPSSGVGMLMLLNLLERTDIAKRGPTDPQAWFLFAEASRVMFADRDRYVADPAFVRVPVEGMLDPAYLDARATLIGSRAGAPPPPGTPPNAPARGADATAEPAGTTHFIVGDARGNVVSMTTTVESIFGTGRMVDGFFLNNQLTDFSFSPTDPDGAPAANAVAAGKRPRSSMTPMILLDAGGQFAGAIGSAGGNAILPYVGKSLVAGVWWKLPMQDALALPNLVARGRSISGEVGKFAPGVVEGLAARGMTLTPGQGEDSGVHAVLVRGGRIDGGYDPRREGRVLTAPVTP